MMGFSDITKLIFFFFLRISACFSKILHCALFESLLLCHMRFSLGPSALKLQKLANFPRAEPKLRAEPRLRVEPTVRNSFVLHRKIAIQLP